MKEIGWKGKGPTSFFPLDILILKYVMPYSGRDCQALMYASLASRRFISCTEEWASMIFCTNLEKKHKAKCSYMTTAQHSVYIILDYIYYTG